MNHLSVLMIAPFPPLPDSGSGIAIFGDLYELNRRNIEVDLVCYRSNRPLKGIQPLESVCRRLIVVDGPPPWSPGVFLAATLQRRPMIVARHFTADMKAAIEQQLMAESYDVVLVEFAFMFQYLLESGLSWPHKKPLLVIDHHVVTPKVYEYFSRVEPNPLLKMFRHYEIPSLKKYLRQVLEVADRHLFLGQEDLDYVKTQSDRLPDHKLVYRPTGLLLDRYPLADPVRAEPDTIGFFGAFDWAANVDAVMHFVENILPLIYAELPTVKFVIAGRAAPDRIRNLGHLPFIEFVGEVDHMFSVVQRLAVVVAPLRIGGGTRLKLLEAMAWGKPIVTTSIGVEGVEHCSGEDLIVADSSESFAKAVLTLLRSPEKQQQLGIAGRRRIELSYTTQQSVNLLLKVLAADPS